VEKLHKWMMQYSIFFQTRPFFSVSGRWILRTGVVAGNIMEPVRLSMFGRWCLGGGARGPLVVEGRILAPSLAGRAALRRAGWPTKHRAHGTTWQNRRLAWRRPPRLRSAEWSQRDHCHHSARGKGQGQDGLVNEGARGFNLRILRRGAMIGLRPGRGRWPCERRGRPGAGSSQNVNQS
jgi:hypothetical protein